MLNVGDTNTGGFNPGSTNTGLANTGNFNTGFANSGNVDTGAFISGNYSNGLFWRGNYQGLFGGSIGLNLDPYTVHAVVTVPIDIPITTTLATAPSPCRPSRASRTASQCSAS